MIANTSKPPGSSQIHVLGDWAELLCLTSAAEALSVADLNSFQIRRRDDPAESDGEMIQIDKSYGDFPIASSESEDEADVKDNVHAKSLQIFEYLAARTASFGEAYPFRLDERGDTIYVRDVSRADRQIYIFLLICSMFSYVDSKKWQTELAGEYEWLCLEGLRNIFPASAELHLFGKNPRSPDRYAGKLRDKLSRLAVDLSEKTMFDDDEFSEHDTGDKGLDIVGWIPLGDGLRSLAIIFGQCACTLKWVLKKSTSSYEAFKRTIALTAPPTNLCFIPYDFRRPDGRWYGGSSVSGVVLFDRRRLMHVLGALTGDGTWIAPGGIQPTLETAIRALDAAKE